MRFLSFLLKLITGLLKGVAWVLVKTGLWVPAAYSLLFLLVALVTGTKLSSVGGVYWVGLTVTTVFAVLVTVMAKISAWRKKRDAKGAAEGSPSPAPVKRDNRVKLVEAPEAVQPLVNGEEGTAQPQPAEQPVQPQPIVQPTAQYAQPPVQPTTQYAQPQSAGQPQFAPYLPPNPPMPQPPVQPEPAAQPYYPQQYPQQAYSPYVAPQNISAPTPQPEAIPDGYAAFGRRISPDEPTSQSRDFGGEFRFERRRSLDGAFGEGESNTEFSARRLDADAPTESRFEAPPFGGRRYDDAVRENAFSRTNEAFTPPRRDEQPRIFRTRMDPNLLIYEYSDRLDFYEITPSGPVLRSSEPKRR